MESPCEVAMASLRSEFLSLATAALLGVLTGCGGGSGGGTTPQATPPAQALPVLLQQPQDATVLVGAPVSFTMKASSADPMTIQWYRGTSALAGATAETYTLPATVKADSGSTFKATVTNLAGTVTTAAARLTVNEPPGQAPVFTLHPQSQTASVGNWLLYSVETLSTTPVTYAWYVGGMLGQKGPGTYFDTRPLTMADTGLVYYVVATNAYGSTTSNSATQTVVPSGVATVTINPFHLTLQAGQSSFFTSYVTGVENTRVTWSLAEPGGGTLTLPEPDAPNQSWVTYRTPSANGVYATGIYHLVATSVADPTRKFTSTLTVTMPTTPPVVATQPSNQVGKVGSLVVFTAAMADEPATRPIGFQWYKNGAPFDYYQTAYGLRPSTELLFTARAEDDQAKFRCEAQAVVNGSLVSVLTAEATLRVTTTNPDYSVAKVIVSQGPQREDNSIPLIEGRMAVFAVWPLSNHTTPNAIKATVRVFSSGDQLLYTSTEEQAAKAGQDASTEDSTRVALTRIPGAYMKAGNRYTVELNRLNEAEEDLHDNNLWPSGASALSGTKGYAPTWESRRIKPLRVKLVPVQTNAGTPDIDLALDTGWIARYLPVADLTVEKTPVWPSPIQDIYNTSWVEGLFTGLMAKRLAEDPAAYYYGALEATPGGFSGLANLGDPGNTTNREAIGLDDMGTLPHELGHTLGFGHADCGGPSGIDTRLYPDGSTHAHFCAIAGDLQASYLGLKAGRDLMSYCWPQGISDRFWDVLIAARAASSTAAIANQGEPEALLQPSDAPLQPSQRQDVLMLLGSRNGQAYTLFPPLKIKSIPTDAGALLNPKGQDGEWLRVELLNRRQELIFTTQLRLGEFADKAFGERLFGANLPAPREPLGAIVLRDAQGQQVCRLEGEDFAAPPELASSSEGVKVLDSNGGGFTLVQDPDTFEVLAVLLGEHRQAKVPHRPGQRLQVLSARGLAQSVAEHPGR